MRRAARAALALQVAGIAVLAVTQVSASAQPSASPSPGATSSPAPSQSPPSSTAPSPRPAPGGASSSPAPSSPAPSSPALTSPSPTPTATATVGPGEPALAVTTRSVEVVAQVGDAVHYRAVVANQGDAPLERIFVVGFLPPEVRFVSADLLPEVEATLYNRIGTKESVTWNVGDIGPGQSLTLSWTGKVTAGGDMTAVSAVTAVADSVRKQRLESRTYLATTSNLGGANPSPAPTTRTVVTYERVPAGEVLGAPAAGDGGTVPETGFDGTLAVAVGALLVALGALLWWAAMPGPRRRRRVGLALTALALLAACTSGRDVDPSASQPTGSPEVKGRRIGPGGEVRDLGGGGRGRDEAAGGEDTDPQGPESDVAGDPTPPPASEPAQPETRLVRRTDVITIDPVIAPPIRLDSRAGGNQVSYSWTGSAVGSLASSTTTSSSPVRIDTEVAESAGGLTALVTITNVRKDAPVTVHGRLRYEIGGRVEATLTSAPLDVMLMPGGATTTSFTYDLPAGAYSVGSSFESN